MSAVLFESWISVKERLPEKDVPVLVCECGTVTTLAVFTEATVDYFTEQKVMRWEVLANCSGYECDEDHCNPDYWTPLPAPPIDSNAQPVVD